MLWKNTVDAATLNLLQEIQNENIFKDFILAGGTALSLQIGHRKSIDIDLFSFIDHDYITILEYLSNKYKNIKVSYQKDFTLQLTLNNVNVDFVSIKNKPLEEPKIIENIKMFGIKDISAMKLSALEGRKKAKDYIDIVYLLKEFTLDEMIENYKMKYEKDNIMYIKKALIESNLVNPYEWESITMFKNDIFISDIPRILCDEVLAYNKKHGIGKKDSVFQKLFKKK